jgi:hypothetical protein
LSTFSGSQDGHSAALPILKRKVRTRGTVMILTVLLILFPSSYAETDYFVYGLNPNQTNRYLICNDLSTEWVRSIPISPSDPTFVSSRTTEASEHCRSFTLNGFDFENTHFQKCIEMTRPRTKHAKLTRFDVLRCINVFETFPYGKYDYARFDETTESFKDCDTFYQELGWSEHAVHSCADDINDYKLDYTSSSLKSCLRTHLNLDDDYSRYKTVSECIKQLSSDPEIFLSKTPRIYSETQPGDLETEFKFDPKLLERLK